MASRAPSSFQFTFSKALRVYRERTRISLLLHPLAVSLQSCDSPRAVVSVLQEQTRAIRQSGSGNKTLTIWLSLTVNVLYSLSSSVQEDVGLVIIDA
jgi:hypothetical protein